MKTNLIYRTATLADKPQLIELGLLAYGQFKDRLGPESWEEMRESIKNEANWYWMFAKSIPLVAVDGDRIAGMAFLFLSGNPWQVYPADWSYIRFVGVHPDYEGQGIGRKLTAWCVEKARESGEKTVALHTSELMLAAQHIYKSLGFKQLERLPDRYGISYWLYRLDL
ncbi:MAG TPA: GNAT family N-acetyltransferase [Fluviicola sp.]|nr:GNAT family N-acetyltransferase [Fluviicola sp.]